MNEVSYLIAFFSGILYFFSPCVLPLIPSFLTYITGISFQDLKAGSRGVWRKTLFSSVIFLSGFTLIFVSLGLGAFSLGSYLIGLKFPIQKIAGSLIILLGFYLLFQNKIKIFLNTKSFVPKLKPLGFLGTFLVGSAFAFSWTPCASPILVAILVSASATTAIKKGFFLLLFFSLGLGIPFLLSALFLSLFLSLAKFIKSYLRFFEIIAGLLLIIFGLYIFSGRPF